MVPMVGDLVFVDTNILLTATDESSPLHEAAGRLVSESGRRGAHLVASGQVVREYLAVATRPVSANGLGLDTSAAIRNVQTFRRFVRLYEENEATTARLQSLGLSYVLVGKRFHDANIVATMSVHGIGTLVTENLKDFASFSEIDAVTIVQMLERFAGI